MSDIGSDFEAARSLVDEKLPELHRLDPKNNLLWWMVIPEDVRDPFDDEEDRIQRFTDRYWDKETPWEGVPKVIVDTVCMTNYFLDLKDEVERLTALL